MSSWRQCFVNWLTFCIFACISSLCVNLLLTESKKGNKETVLQMLGRCIKYCLTVLQHHNAWSMTPALYRFQQVFWWMALGNGTMVLLNLPYIVRRQKSFRIRVLIQLWHKLFILNGLNLILILHRFQVVCDTQSFSQPLPLSPPWHLDY